MRSIYCIVAIKTTVERYTFYLTNIRSFIAPGFVMSRIIGSKQRSNLIRLIYIVYKNPTNCVGVVQSRSHHRLIEK